MADEQQPPDSVSRGLTDVQLSELVVQGLFGKYTHKIPLPTSSEDDSLPSVVILYGPNGVGKTTVLRMLDGLIRLDFDVFREVPFESCHLSLNTGQRLQVKRQKQGLSVSFEDVEVVLDPQLGVKGALRPQDAEKVEAFRANVFQNLENISFNFIDSNRAQRSKFDSPELDRPEYIRTSSGEVVMRMRYDPSQPGRTRRTPLADEVKQFIRDAQLDSRAFFAGDEPDLFNKLVEDLMQSSDKPTSAKEIRRILEQVHLQDESQARLGLRRDRWDYGRLTSMLSRRDLARDSHTLTVLGTYADFLSSRSQARQLIAERLLTFEEVMDEFLVGKTVRVDVKSGLRISTNGTSLNERRLSSGEHQLLYLMVAALTTRRRGTVIAIDEPEMSMHIAWQRKLVHNLIRCASRAAPQFVLATHSPEVATQFSENMIELSAHVDDN